MAVGVCMAVSLLTVESAQALTVKVGKNVGPPGLCEFDSPQEAIDALPDNGQMHTLEVEAGTYIAGDAPVDVNGRRITIATRFKANSRCLTPSEPGERTELRTSQTSLLGGRTVVVRNGGNLVLESVEIRGNEDGGVFVRDSNLTLLDGVVSGNSTSAGSSGAGIVIEGGVLTVDDTVMIGNTAGANGGAIFCAKGASGIGSSVFIKSGSRILENSAIRGGGIYQFRGCTLQISDDVFLSGNHAELDGGAIGTDPGASALADRNVLILDDFVDFFVNVADRDGGAISIAGMNSMTSRADAVPRFRDNLAKRYGGAIHIANAGAQGDLAGAEFLLNEARERGGAISVSGGEMSLAADCAEGDTLAENYCALFEGNEVRNEGSLPRKGGALNLDGGTLSVEGFAFRNSIGPATVVADSGGVIGFVASGFLRIANSIVYDNPDVRFQNQHLFQLNGGLGQFSFNTMVDLRAGSVIFSQPGARAELVGNIIAGNSAGLVGDGDVSGTCNNVQLGDDPVPLDPRLVTTAAGRYRLAADSPMIGLALSCRNGSLPAGYEFPQNDLDGHPRIGEGEAEREMDLGAFEFRIDTDIIFAAGFEILPTK
jgi:predicted outer membrane repeat protein